MKIAYLVLCHADAKHVARLAAKLTVDAPGCHVFVHVDAKSPALDEFIGVLRGMERVTLVEPRVRVWWGGASAIDATHCLLRESFAAGCERFVLLQGADYPLMSNLAIEEFFERHPTTEFIRASNAARGRSRYIYSKSRHVLFFDRPNLAKKVWNKLTRIFDLKLRNGTVRTDDGPWDLHWGCAQFALTRDAVDYLLGHANSISLRRQFDTVFPADEIYFHTLIFNSRFAPRTVAGGAETGISDLVEARTLHYFEYPDLVRIFTAADDDYLAARDEMFVRKVNTAQSSGLLDLIDARHAAQSAAMTASAASAQVACQ